MSRTSSHTGVPSRKGSSGKPKPPLPYTIFDSSPTSAEYGPQNLLVDKPTDLSSRWSVSSPVNGYSEAKAGGSRDGAFVTLELKQWAVLTACKFGKAMKAHPCNAQWVKIYAGPSPENLYEVGGGPLRNDAQADSFSLRMRGSVWTGEMEREDWNSYQRWEADDAVFPVRYIKICPGPAYEPRFNTSLWHIRLEGWDQKAGINKIRESWEQYQALLCSRLMLKELRAKRLDSVYSALTSSLVGKPGYPEFVLEHPALTQLFHELVQEGMFDAAEQTLSRIRDLGLFTRSMRGPDKIVLQQLADKSQAPASRQSFALANEGPKLHLFGGVRYDRNLSDFWSADVGEDDTVRWEEIRRENPDDLWPPATKDAYMVAGGDYIAMTCTPAAYGEDMPRRSASELSWGEEPDSTVQKAAFGLVDPETMDIVSSTAVAAEPTWDRTLWIFSYKTRKWSEVEFPDCGASADTLSSNTLGPMGIFDMRTRKGGFQVFFRCSKHMNCDRLWRIETSDWGRQELAYDDESGELHESMLYLQQVMEERCPGYTALQNQPRVQITRDHISGNILMFRSIANVPLTFIDMYDEERQEMLHDKFQVYEPHEAALECGSNEVAPENLGNNKIWVQSGHENMRCKLIRLERNVDLLNGISRLRRQRFLEMIGQSDTMEVLEYLKGPLQDVSGKDTEGIKMLTGRMFQGDGFKTEEEKWRARLQVFEEISNAIDFRYAQPRDSMAALLPI